LIEFLGKGSWLPKQFLSRKSGPARPNSRQLACTSKGVRFYQTQPTSAGASPGPVPDTIQQFLTTGKCQRGNNHSTVRDQHTYRYSTSLQEHHSRTPQRSHLPWKSISPSLLHPMVMVLPSPGESGMGYSDPTCGVFTLQIMYQRQSLYHAS
jgi:hypothetical protein